MPISSPVWPSAALPLEESELDCYRDLQQLAYRCLQLAASRLTPGLTGRQATDLVRLTFTAAGVHDFAVRPQVRFTRPRRGLLPGPRLRPGTGCTLRATPRLGDRTAPAVLTTTFGRHPATDALIAELPAYRDHLLHEIRHGSSAAQLLAGTAAFATRRGHTLASPTLLAPVSPTPFSPDSPLPPGLWTITPHLTAGPATAAFAELLVVTSHSACWLDDDLPHAGPAVGPAR